MVLFQYDSRIIRHLASRKFYGKRKKLAALDIKFYISLMSKSLDISVTCDDSSKFINVNVYRTTTDPSQIGEHNIRMTPDELEQFIAQLTKALKIAREGGNR